MTDAAPTSVFNTLTMRIAASPDVVWSLFLDRSRWMPSFVSRRLVRGPDGLPGALAEVRMDVDGGSLRLEETLFVEPRARLVVRITAEGTPMMAHADFQLRPDGDGTLMQVSIHTWLPSRAPVIRHSDIRETTQSKITADFTRLRHIAHEVAGR